MLGGKERTSREGRGVKKVAAGPMINDGKAPAGGETS